MSELASTIGVKSACAVLNVPRSRIYRQRQPKAEPVPRPTPAHALSHEERMQVRDTLNSERFMDQAPRQVYAALLDEGHYLCHWRTMYRILAAHGEVCERRLIPPTKSRNCWQKPPTRSGHGTLPGCGERTGWRSTRSTRCWIFSAVMWSVG